MLVVVLLAVPCGAFGTVQVMMRDRRMEGYPICLNPRLTKERLIRSEPRDVCFCNYSNVLDLKTKLRTNSPGQFLVCARERICVHILLPNHPLQIVNGGICP